MLLKRACFANVPSLGAFISSIKLDLMFQKPQNYAVKPTKILWLNFHFIFEVGSAIVFLLIRSVLEIFRGLPLTISLKKRSMTCSRKIHRRTHPLSNVVSK